jgi:DNA-binding IclR family transcriptional regulator
VSVTQVIGLLRRVQSEFREMPGLCLTPQQAERLWSIDSSTCERLMSTLARARILRRRDDGSFILAGGGSR